MAGYASDQFYNFGNSYEKDKTTARTKEDNPNFLWPSPVDPDVYNPIIGPQTVSTRFQRGFIRGIYPSVLAGVKNPSASNVKQRRLFFQFNPSTIDRSVQMNAMVANPLLQDPAQLYQPVAGTAAFSFELLFNREAEVVSAMYAQDQLRQRGYATKKATPLMGSMDSYGTSTKWDDVASLGVLADMYILDSIIGQSITPDMVDFLAKYWSNISDTSKVYAESGQGASVGFDETGFRTNIVKNYGNAAFLSPLPVRIVFSSLFMVEGFVESSSVQFVKFSKNYVPTICKVSLNVRALYIGFAKEEAYLTTSLKTAVADMASERQATEAAQKQSQAVSYSIGNLTLVPSSMSMSKYNGTANQTASWPLYTDNIYTWWNYQYPGWTSGDRNKTITLKGDLKSWVSAASTTVIKTNNLSWSFEIKLTITELLENGDSSVLATDVLKYKNNSQSKDLESKTIASNALSKNSSTKANTDKWIFNTDVQQQTIQNANSTIEFKMETIITTTNGTVSTTDTRTAVYKAKANSSADWQKLVEGKAAFVFNPPQVAQGVR